MPGRASILGRRNRIDKHKKGLDLSVFFDGKAADINRFCFDFDLPIELTQVLIGHVSFGENEMKALDETRTVLTLEIEQIPESKGREIFTLHASEYT